VVALAERAEAKGHPMPTVVPIAADDRPTITPPSDHDDDASPDAARASGARNGALRGARRPRQERRLGKAAPLTDGGHDETLPPGGDDAVMPLDSSPRAPLGKTTSPAPATGAPANAPPAFARTTASRAFRPIDVEDPFAGPAEGSPARGRKTSRDDSARLSRAEPAR